MSAPTTSLFHKKTFMSLISIKVKKFHCKEVILKASGTGKNAFKNIIRMRHQIRKENISEIKKYKVWIKAKYIYVYIKRKIFNTLPLDKLHNFRTPPLVS